MTVIDTIIKFGIAIVFVAIFVYFISMGVLTWWQRWTKVAPPTVSDSIEKFQGTMNRYVCMFAYYEKNDEYKENLSYFLKYAITDSIDYYIIINGTCSVKIPTDAPNITVIYRPNKGYDFGAWEYCIKNYIVPSNQTYDYYIFLNSSVRGPIPSSLAGDGWLNRFLELFQNNNVKLVGTTINVLMETWEDYPLDFTPPYTHVQSMFFVLNYEGFQFLLKRGFFDDEEILNNTTDMKYIVANKEIPMSQLILKNNWNINAMLPNYRDRDYRYVKYNFNPSSDNPCRTGDDPDKKNYFGRDIYPEEVIFFKTNLSNVGEAQSSSHS